jgi:hypothetical protein
MKALNDLDFLSLFWAEAKQIGQRILRDLPKCATPNNGKQFRRMYIVNFSDISGQSWGVKEVLSRVMGNSETLNVLADKINYMILEGRAKDVKPMLEKIISRQKHFGHKKSKEVKRIEYLKNTTGDTSDNYYGKGHFKWNYQAYTLNEAEIRRVKEYFNIK